MFNKPQFSKVRETICLQKSVAFGISDVKKPLYALCVMFRNQWHALCVHFWNQIEFSTLWHKFAVFSRICKKRWLVSRVLELEVLGTTGAIQLNEDYWGECWVVYRVPSMMVSSVIKKSIKQFHIVSVRLQYRFEGYPWMKCLKIIIDIT